MVDPSRDSGRFKEAIRLLRTTEKVEDQQGLISITLEFETEVGSRS
jgi:hypothetical protein